MAKEQNAKQRVDQQSSQNLLQGQIKFQKSHWLKYASACLVMRRPEGSLCQTQKSRRERECKTACRSRGHTITLELAPIQDFSGMSSSPDETTLLRKRSHAEANHDDDYLDVDNIEQKIMKSDDYTPGSGQASKTKRTKKVGGSNGKRGHRPKNILHFNPYIQDPTKPKMNREEMKIASYMKLFERMEKNKEKRDRRSKIQNSEEKGSNGEPSKNGEPEFSPIPKSRDDKELMAEESGDSPPKPKSLKSQNRDNSSVHSNSASQVNGSTGNGSHFTQRPRTLDSEYMNPNYDYKTHTSLTSFLYEYEKKQDQELKKRMKEPRDIHEEIKSLTEVPNLITPIQLNKSREVYKNFKEKLNFTKISGDSLKTLKSALAEFREALRGKNGEKTNGHSRQFMVFSLDTFLNIMDLLCLSLSLSLTTQSSNVKIILFVRLEILFTSFFLVCSI
eukprot:TRINITY_DN5224_c0_g1_i23.p1 TRINITY_DN5224_c0_g1~~TRINITY_DN5224_c0_g1_i23.p1  ORF type:complete len:447 (-),score=47.14 TRINITY_DN5224_c0_g1_i23:205-1545(-)